MLEYFVYFMEFYKATITIPGFLFFLAFLYRKEFCSLLARLRSYSKGGHQIDFDPIQQDEKEGKNINAPFDLQKKDLPSVFVEIPSSAVEYTTEESISLDDAPATKIVEQYLGKSLKLIDEKEKIDRLTYSLAEARVDLLFERSYHAIFGSQLEL